MVWEVLFFCAVAVLIGLHLYWRARAIRLESDCQRLQRECEAARAKEAGVRAEITAREEKLLNSISQGILFLDSQMRITRSNEAVVLMLKPSGSLEGKTLMEAFRLHPLVELVSEVQKAAKASEVEISVPGPQPRFFQVTASRWTRSGGAETILTFHDITRLKHFENVRKDFVANVSHELRTPLSLIKGFSETLLDGAMRDENAAPRFIEKIFRNAERLALIIDDLLTISSLESGQIAIEKQSLRLQPLVARVIADLQTRPEAKATIIENAVSPELVACADLQRLQQVLSNLVDNAVKYGRQNGRVRIAAKVLPDSTTQISVSDDGPGIPPNALDRIFERFYRVDKARSREQGGTGLGLSIVKHLVQSHGGRVWAESELEKGSTFFFTLPPETA